MTRDLRHLTPEQVSSLTLPTEPWLSCDDCFRLMDQYVEALLHRQGDVDVPGMDLHLRGCAACAEEAESLLHLVAAEDGIDPSPAITRLRG
jgi:hypothetical protein